MLAVGCRRGGVWVQCGGRGALNENATIPSCGRIRRIYPRIYRPVPQERRRRCPIGGATIRLIIGREPVADAGGRVLERHRLARGCDRESSLLESAIGIIFDEIGRASCREGVCQYV